MIVKNLGFYKKWSMSSFKENEIIFLLGAGASANADIPVSSQMDDRIKNLITNDSDWKRYEKLYYLIKSGINYSAGLSGQSSTFNIETLLFVLEELKQKEKHLLYPFIGSWNIRFNEVVKDNFKLIESFMKEIKKKLKEWVDLEDERKAEYFKHLAILRQELNFPLRIFTLNYDKCIETNTNNTGFEFTLERGFDPVTRKWNYKLFDPIRDLESDVYLYKLHGSIDWKRDANTNIVSYSNGVARNPDLIFGTQNKLSYSDPYLFLFSQFRHYTLSAKLIVCIGYSFADEHINGLIEQAIKQDDTKRVISVMKGTNKTESELKEFIASRLNISVDKIIIEQSEAKDFFENKLNLEYFTQIFPIENDEDNVFR